MRKRRGTMLTNKDSMNADRTKAQKNEKLFEKYQRDAMARNIGIPHAKELRNRYNYRLSQAQKLRRARFAVSTMQLCRALEKSRKAQRIMRYIPLTPQEIMSASLLLVEAYKIYCPSARFGSLNFDAKRAGACCT